jgi:hypothetical protein
MLSEKGTFINNGHLRLKIAARCPLNFLKSKSGPTSYEARTCSRVIPNFLRVGLSPILSIVLRTLVDKRIRRKLFNSGM